MNTQLKSWLIVGMLSMAMIGCGAGGGGGTDISVSDVGNVEGTVTDASTGTALSGVTVQVGDKSDVTGDNGVYSIQDIDVGSRTITATITGYQSYSGTVTVSKGTTVSHNIEMTATGTTPDTTPPTVSSISPASNATGVAVSSGISVTFSEAMDCSTITTSSFTLRDSSNNAVAGTITTCNNASAVFTPSSSLSYSTNYTATITTGVKDAANNAMASDYTWTFMTASAGGGETSGSLDTTFGTGGIVTNTSGAFSDGMTIQPDGLIVSVGVTNNKDFYVVRYGTNGNLDSSFGTNGLVITDLSSDDRAMAVGIQADGKIVVTGYATGSSQDTAVVRYNTNGSIDSSFGTNGNVVTSASSSSDHANSIAIQSDGKIITAGYSNGDFLVLRYNSNGSLDTTFGTNGIVTTDISASSTDVAWSVAIQTDGKIVVGGGYYDNNNFGFAAVRYNANGTIDATFGSGGKTTTIVSNPGAGKGSSIDYVARLALQSDGKIVMAGNPQTGISYTGADWVIVRYDANGSLDATFGTAGKVTTDLGGSYEKPYGLIIQTDGKIVAAGGSGTSGSNMHSALVRYNVDGTLDSTFGNGGKVSTSIGSSFDMFCGVGIQSDGKIVAAGGASNDGSTVVFSLARYWL